MIARSALGIATLLLGLGCAKPQAVSSGPAATASSTEQSAPSPSKGGDAPSATSTLHVVLSAEQAGKLGSPCTDASTCGTQNRIALRAYGQMRFAGVDSAPCALQTTATQQDSSPPQEVSACVAGGVLYAESRCVMCRMPQAALLEAVIAELTPQQIAEVRRFVGLRGDATLRDAAEWQHAITAAHRDR